MTAGDSFVARRSAASWWISGLAVAVVAVVLVRTAWLSDDAFITLRTVDNFVNGYGLRWNVAERVQSYTHPAWLLLITPFYAVTHEPFYTVLTIQILLTLATIWLIVGKLARTPGDAVLAGVVLVSSKAFIDFSTGGLENPFVHLLLVLFVLEWQSLTNRGGAGLTRIGILTSLILLCRLDLGLLIAPVLFSLVRPVSRARIVSFALGLTPFVCWELFSLVYYGQLVPNTAVAKLPPGVPMSALAAQGLRYFEANFEFDLLTIAFIGFGLIALPMTGGYKGRILASGIALQLIYLVCIGGDFMAGRFLTPILLMSVVGRVVAMPLVRRPEALIAVIAVLLVSLGNPDGPLRAGRDFGRVGQPAGAVDRWGVLDERKVYYPDLGLLRVASGEVSPSTHENAKTAIAWRPLGRPTIASSVGIAGYYAGPTVHVIDRMALADPLLARLPPVPKWRIGHFEREVPAGYFESCLKNENLIENTYIRDLYAAVRTVTRGPVFSVERARAIWWLHFRR